MDLMYSLELRALARDAQSKDMQMCSPTWLIIETGSITSFAQIKMQIHIFSAFECAEIINFFYHSTCDIFSLSTSTDDTC